MNTISRQISDLKQGDKVLHYGSIFLVTENARLAPHHTGTVPVARCKRIEVINYYESLDGLLAGYDVFQGLWTVPVITD